MAALTSEPNSAPNAAPTWSVWLVGAVLMLVTIGLYWPAAGHGFLEFDDNTYVVNNPHVNAGLTWESARWAFTESYACNWHPLTWIAHMLDCSLFGLEPRGHHLTSIGLHAVDTLLIFLLLRRLTGAFWRSAVVAALFGWHPLNVESVAWVAELKSVLSTFFGLLALWFYTCYAQSRTKLVPPVNSSFFIFHSSFSYWLSWLCLALGLMSKSILVTWPFVMLLLDYWPLARWEPARVWPLVREKIPFFAVVVAVCVITFAVQRQGGAVVDAGSLSLDVRLANALVSYCRYAGKIFWPTHLAIYYPHPWDWQVELTLLAGGALAALSAICWVHRRRFPFLLIGWLWFVGTLVPMIGVVQVGAQAMADRYAYVPALGVFIMAVWGAHAFARRWRRGWIGLAAAATVAMGLCLALTRHELNYWRDTEALARRAIAVTTGNYIAHDLLGNALFAKGETNAAIDEFQAAIQVNRNYALAHNNLGSALFNQGKVDDALDQFRQAIRLMPGYAPAHNNLAVVLAKQGQTMEATDEFKKALRLQPDSANAYNDLGNLLAQQGQTDAAIQAFQAAIHWKPAYAEAHNQLGAALFKTGQTPAAIEHYQTALRLKPEYGEAHNNLGTALASEGQTDAAITEFKEAVRLSPKDASGHDNLGVALTSKGQTDAAIQEFQQALRLKPDDAEAGNDLGYLWVEQGEHLDQARTMIEKAVATDPQNSDFLGSMGWVLLKLHHPAEALDYLRRAATNSSPPDADLYDHLGDADAALQQLDEARAAWQKSLAIKPNPLVEKKLNGSSTP